MYATAPHGLQFLLADELGQLGATDIKVAGAGVRFHCSHSNAYRICLESRVANRVLLPIHRGQADTPDNLYKRVREVDWASHMSLETTFSIDFFCDRSAITHSGFGAQKTKDAIVDQFRESQGERPSVDRKAPDLRINAYLFRDNLRLAIDWSGRSLHQRGYRLSEGAAPLKENLAAATLIACGWPDLARQGQALHDPMCGSGTFVIEAAMIAADVAPGLFRDRFGFHGWRQYDQTLWQEVRNEVEHRARRGKELLQKSECQISGADIHPSVLTAAHENLQAAELTHLVNIGQSDFFEKHAPTGNTGLVVFNPPYGERLSSKRTPTQFFRDCSRILHDGFRDWQAALVIPDKSPHHLLRLGKTRESNATSNDKAPEPLRFSNGGIACRVVTGALTARQQHGTKNQSTTAPKAQPQLPKQPAVSENDGLDFANRLKKNRKRLNAWLKRESIAAYRLYDADIPAYAVAIDLYNGVPVSPDWSGGQRWHESIDPRGIKTESGQNSTQNNRHASSAKTPKKKNESTSAFSAAKELHAVLQEYRAPSTIDSQTAAARLTTALGHTKAVLDLNDAHLHVKLREKQKGSQQYTRRQQNNQRLLVEEYGCKLLINPSDYLDTGLFTDHRKVRHYIQKHSDGKRFLNLFCYTASATAHAIQGGATRSVSVDTSKRYLYWAADNLSLNDCQSTNHQLVREDVMTWLKQNRETFDLILLDPPTFSNSNRNEHDWDVQRHHGDCIRECLRHLSADGLIIFSTNFKRFRMNDDLADRTTVEERSDWSIGPDYSSNRKIHRCWFIKHRQTSM